MRHPKTLKITLAMAALSLFCLGLAVQSASAQRTTFRTSALSFDPFTLQSTETTTIVPRVAARDRVSNLRARRLAWIRRILQRARGADDTVATTTESDAADQPTASAPLSGAAGPTPRIPRQVRFRSPEL